MSEEKKESSKVVFQSVGSEREWLKGALTGCLKEQYYWEEYGEEIREECAEKLKITNLGSNLVLMQSETEVGASGVTIGYEDWTGYWSEWCGDGSRKIWTKWAGVPLYA